MAETRIDTLEQRVAALEAENKRLKAPIQLSEVIALYGKDYVDADEDTVMGHIGFAECIRIARANTQNGGSNEQH